MSWFGLGSASQQKKVKACALIGLHMMAEENSWRSDSGSFVSSRSSGENNVGNDALFAIGLQGSGDTVALFLQDWEGGKGSFELPHSPGHVVPGNEVERRRGWFGF